MLLIAKSQEEGRREGVWGWGGGLSGQIGILTSWLTALTPAGLQRGICALSWGGGSKGEVGRERWERFGRQWDAPGQEWLSCRSCWVLGLSKIGVISKGWASSFSHRHKGEGDLLKVPPCPRAEGPGGLLGSWGRSNEASGVSPGQGSPSQQGYSAFPRERYITGTTMFGKRNPKLPGMLLRISSRCYSFAS